ncbi:MAG: LPD38 domain-containing protein, partial [Sulfurimonas sp.]
MNRDRLKYIHSEGLESEDFIKMLDENYDNYVPLRREFADKESFLNTGKGFDIRGRETMRAVGSDRKVESPLMHSISAFEETIVRSEKNQVGKSFLEFTKEFPDESLYSVADMKHMPQYDKNGAVVGMSPNYKKDDNVFHVKVDGKIKEITIHDPALAAAFTNLNAQQMNSLLLASQKAVRVIAGLSTSYNPEFVVTNFTRDIQTAMINMPDGMKANRATIIKDVMPAMKGIYSSLRDGSKNEWSTLFEEMRKEGGTTGWHDLHGVLDMKKSTQAIIDKYDGKVAPVQAFKEVLNYINDVNGAVENASRLVAYKMAKDSGKTNKQAASIAKNLTVNFNRKGEMGAGLNALYMFYNASIQGSTRMVQQLAKSRTSQALVATIAGVGVGLDMWNRSQNAEAYAVLDDYIKDTNYIFMYKDGTYSSLKLPYGYNVFKATGDLASAMYHGEMEAAKIPKRILSMTVNAFSPIGVDAESITHTAAPTLVKPFIEIAENRNHFGGNIAPVQNPYEAEKPDSQNYFKSVNPLAKGMAQGVNELTGGNMYEKGGIDVSPESIEHIIEFATGGLGKLVMRTGTVIDQALDEDKKVDINKVPFLRGVYGVPREKAETNIIYKMYKESGGNAFSEVERNRFIKWTAAALEKKDITSDQAKKLKKVFNDNQRRLDFANKYNLQNKEEYQSSETLQDAGRREGLTKQQRKELLKEDK